MPFNPDTDSSLTNSIDGAAIEASAFKTWLEFLSGYFGGPQYYVERMGHANLQYMHEHIEIGPAEVEAWLTCMKKAIVALGYDAHIETALMRHFTRSAHALQSRA